MEYQQIKEENLNFLKKYKLSKKLVDEFRINSINKLSSFQMTFGDLISSYKEKGYKISDLSNKKNLFDSSSLILDNCKIVPNFNSALNLKSYLKDLTYLQKIEDSMNDKFQVDGKVKKIVPPLIYESELNLGNKSKKELIEEINAKQKYIIEARRLVDSDEYKHIYDLQLIDMKTSNSLY